MVDSMIADKRSLLAANDMLEFIGFVELQLDCKAGDISLSDFGIKINVRGLTNYERQAPLMQNGPFRNIDHVRWNPEQPWLDISLRSPFGAIFLK